MPGPPNTSYSQQVTCPAKIQDISKIRKVWSCSRRISVTKLNGCQCRYKSDKLCCSFWTSRHTATTIIRHSLFLSLSLSLSFCISVFPRRGYFFPQLWQQLWQIPHYRFYSELRHWSRSLPITVITRIGSWVAWHYVHGKYEQRKLTATIDPLSWGLSEHWPVLSSFKRERTAVNTHTHTHRFSIRMENDRNILISLEFFIGITWAINVVKRTSSDNLIHLHSNHLPLS